MSLRLRAWLLLLSLLLGGAATVRAEDVVQASEARVKAAFLFKFGDYVEWPGSNGGAFTFGVLGADDVATELSAILADRSVAGRPATLRRLRPGESFAGLQVLFVGRGNLEGLAPLHGQPILVITDSDRGLPPESVINFLKVAERLRFDVSLKAARARGLKVSSRLLVVARRVVPAT